MFSPSDIPFVVFLDEFGLDEEHVARDCGIETLRIFESSILDIELTRKLDIRRNILVRGRPINLEKFSRICEVFNSKGCKILGSAGFRFLLAAEERKARTLGHIYGNAVSYLIASQSPSIEVEVARFFGSRRVFVRSELGSLVGKGDPKDWMCLATDRLEISRMISEISGAYPEAEFIIFKEFDPEIASGSLAHRFCVVEDHIVDFSSPHGEAQFRLAQDTAQKVSLEIKTHTPTTCYSLDIVTNQRGGSKVVELKPIYGASLPNAATFYRGILERFGGHGTALSEQSS